MSDASTTSSEDPRSAIARWANDRDEWVRHIVACVLRSGAQATNEELDYAYNLFRQSKKLDTRALPVEALLEVETAEQESESVLTLKRISDVTGVNALTPGAVIEPHAGLTILYGENGTGKTGYSRILKSIAGSRTADTILGDIAASTQVPIGATIEYALGDDSVEHIWAGEHTQPPFTRMSIFDSPAVNFHVDDDLEYVYTPASLALFNHINLGLRAVQRLIDERLTSLQAGNAPLLSRFLRDDDIFEDIETLGATTDLEDLKRKRDESDDPDAAVETVQLAVAALQVNSPAVALALRQREQRVIVQAHEASQALHAASPLRLNEGLAQVSRLEAERDAFRMAFFSTADLPSEPGTEWESFVRAGDDYRQHLQRLGKHEDTRCLYCRQLLDATAEALVSRYSDYLLDKVGADVNRARGDVRSRQRTISSIPDNDVRSYYEEFKDRSDKPTWFGKLESLKLALEESRRAVETGGAIDLERTNSISSTAFEADLGESATAVEAAQKLVDNRSTTLAARQKELISLRNRVELRKSWPQVEAQTLAAKEADRLAILAKPLPATMRSLTELSKVISDQLVNESFDKLFQEECDALRAPALKVEFIGRQGKAQRRKVLSGKHRPSRVLSEGEQKVLAIADFLAEARLSGISAPVVFDDPVSSLDHRRVSEVADRIASLAEVTQVIVFTHDVLFAASLLTRFEVSKRCIFYQITDDGGKGQIVRATGPRWDSVSELTKRVNSTIDAARKEEGESRDALVRTGYGWIRSWCEVYTEMELLKGITQRYQPNVRMTLLGEINNEKLPEVAATVSKVFEDACRYIDSHSQPLASLNTTPTMKSLELDWATLQAAKKLYASKGA